MCSVLVVILYIFRKQPLQMTFVERNHVIQEVAAAASDPALGNAILPGTANRCPDGGELHGFYGGIDLTAELRIMIENQILPPVIVGKRFPQLLRDPTTGWMLGDADVQNTAAIMADDEKAVQQPKGNRRHGEKVHRSDSLAMIPEKCLPALRGFGIARRSVDPARDRALGNIESQLQEFAMNTRRAPSWILSNHAKNQLANIFADSLATQNCVSLRQELPIQPESCAVPGDHGSGSNDQQTAFPAGPQFSNRDPKQPIKRFQPWVFVLALQDRELLAQSKIFKHKRLRDEKRRLMNAVHNQNRSNMRVVP